MEDSVEQPHRLFRGHLYFGLPTEPNGNDSGCDEDETAFNIPQIKSSHPRFPKEDKRGMRITSGKIVLEKDSQNMIGISIGGGFPNCPCLYVVQIFDGTPAANNGELSSGDEITSINGECVKNRSKVEVARLIQSYKDSVTIYYNKLHADSVQGKSLDIILKKVKHQIVENINTSTADSLGFSRAILVNDSLVKKLEELNSTGRIFILLMNHTQRVLRAIFNLAVVHRAFGEVFADVGVKEPQPRASEAFTDFAVSHRAMEKFAMEALKKLKPMVTDLKTFITKVIPDTRLTVKKYLDTKFEYLSYCLKVKEMDDEEYSFAALRESLYRVETGNYEYRLILRCRQEARQKFAQLRNDVLVKIELVDNKHVQDIVQQLSHFVDTLKNYYRDCFTALQAAQIFPIELDLNVSTFCVPQPLDHEEGGEERTNQEGRGEDANAQCTYTFLDNVDTPGGDMGRARDDDDDDCLLLGDLTGPPDEPLNDLETANKNYCNSSGLASTGLDQFELMSEFNQLQLAEQQDREKTAPLLSADGSFQLADFLN